MPDLEEFLLHARRAVGAPAAATGAGRAATREYEVQIGERTHRVKVTGADGRYEVTVGEFLFRVDSREIQVARGRGARARSLLVNDRSFDAEIEPQGPGRLAVSLGGHDLVVEVRDSLAAHLARQTGGRKRREGPEVVASPMPGLVVSVAVAPGDVVSAGRPVAVVEAMKMQNELAALHGGRVIEVRVRPGQAVDSGQALVVIEPEG